jgi:hypothetical protein
MRVIAVLCIAIIASVTTNPCPANIPVAPTLGVSINTVSSNHDTVTPSVQPTTHSPQTQAPRQVKNSVVTFKLRGGPVGQNIIALLLRGVGLLLHSDDAEPSYDFNADNDFTLDLELASSSSEDETLNSNREEETFNPKLTRTRNYSIKTPTTTPSVQPTHSTATQTQALSRAKNLAVAFKTLEPDYAEPPYDFNDDNDFTLEL